MRKIILISSILFLFTSLQLKAEIRHVPDEYNFIQFAINDCNDGDVVIVSEGTYYENINFDGRNITLKSIDPNNPDIVSATIIDGSQANSVVIFSGTEDSNCVMTGFTITGGRIYKMFTFFMFFISQ